MKTRKNHAYKSEQIVNSLELPKDLFLGVPVFTMNGDGELLIENHRGIAQYDDTQMVIRSKPFPIKIAGQNLHMEFFTTDAMKICGKIEAIYLSL